MAGFLVVNDVVAGVDRHEDLDATLRAFDVLRRGYPDQLAVGCDTKDIEGRDHHGRYITNGYACMYEVAQAGLGLSQG
jgi:hypothetical protein